MTNEYQLQNRAKKNLALQEKRKEIMSLPPEKALDTILSADLPAELIQSFSEQDLYLLVHDIGLNDALPIIALAHSDQWGFMLDVEIWERDRLDLDLTTHWFKVLLLSDMKRMVRWLLEERLEFLELYLFRNIEVIIREENEDPSDFPDGFFTVDDYFYVRIKEKPEPLIVRDGEEPVTQDDLEEVIHALIDQIMAMDYYLYQQIMLESMSVIAAEVEEEDFRFRNVRLSEKGFLPFDEALEVYSPLDPDQIGKHSATRTSLSPSDPDWLPSPLSHVREIKEQNLFSDSLEVIGTRFDLSELDMEFAALCNQIIAAEQKAIRDKAGLAHVVQKAVANISLGLEVLLDQEGTSDSTTRMNLVMAHSLKNLFRVGLGRIIHVKRQAQAMIKDSWFHRQKLPLTFWGEQGLGVIGGLLVEKPVYYDNYASGTLYRDFKTLDDILKTEKVLSDIQGFDQLLTMMAPRMDDFKDLHLTCYSLVMTLWVHAKSGKPVENEGPVAMDDVRRWFGNLWEPGERDPDTSRGEIRETEKKDVLAWLSNRSGFTEQEISSRMGQALETMFREFENEYGTVHVDNLNSKYITHLCIVDTLS